MERATNFLLTVALLAAFGAGGFMYGQDKATKAAELAEQGRTAKAVKAQKDADDKVLANQRELRQADQKRIATYQQDHEHADSQAQAVISELRSGARRLRIAVQRPVCPAAPDAGGTAATGTGEEGFADVDPRASEWLVGLTRRGDDAIAKHAAVVDLYEHLRAACQRQGAPIEVTK